MPQVVNKIQEEGLIEVDVSLGEVPSIQIEKPLGDGDPLKDDERTSA